VLKDLPLPVRECSEKYWTAPNPVGEMDDKKSEHHAEARKSKHKA
jgi:hypothetical protein